MTIMRKYNYLTRKEMQGTELAGKEKTEYKTIYGNIYIHIFNTKKVTTMGKRHLKT